jgi:anaerobic magnesium-protoporphyrin IX monomethyl ester cyclase
MRVTLIQPPDGNLPTAPYSSIAALTGVLAAHGHQLDGLDVNLETTLWLLDQKRLEGWWDMADRKRAALTQKPDRTPEEAKEMLRLQRLLSLPREEFAGVADAVDLMRDAERFGNPEEFVVAFDLVRSCMRFAFSLSPFNFFEGRKVGHGVLTDPPANELPDPPVESFRMLVEKVLENPPDAIGITVPFDGSMYFGLKIARVVKQLAPDMTVLMGGAGIDNKGYRVTEDPFYFQVVDYVMVGEGEVQFPKLLDVLENGGDISTVKNMRWLEDGVVRATELELVTDLNSPPGPDFSTVDFKRYLLPDAVATFQSSRGCYYGKCTFCSELFRKGFRIRKPDLVVDDMVKIYEQTGIRHFQLWDSLAPPKTLKKIAQEVIKRGLPFEWMAETKFEKPYRNEEMIKTLAEGGCTFLQFGFESASSKVLDLIDKGNSIEDTKVILELLAKYGIRAGTTWFIGFPGETEHEADFTHDFVGTRRDQVMLSSYTRTFDIGADTIVYEDKERFGIEVFEVSEGVLDYRYTDGRERWNPDERDMAFHARGDFPYLTNNIELHYAKVPKEVSARIAWEYRMGPILRQVAPEALSTMKLTLMDAVRVRVYDEHASGGQTPFGTVWHLTTGYTFDLEKPSVAIVRALTGAELTYEQLLAATGLDDATARDLVDQGINRGIIKILVDEKHVRWIPEAAQRDAPTVVAHA